MTLHERIEKDLKELFQGKPISEAVRLPKKLQVSIRGLPQHFVGNPKADTVLVMLNPGGDSKQADHCFYCASRCYNRASAKTFIRSYVREKQSFGRLDRTRPDPFDLKQAAFLRDWKDSGINLPKRFTGIKDTDSKNGKLAAKEAVLMNKLQLELVPYCSRQFKTDLFAKNARLCRQLFPFLETILEEIVSRRRQYVVFCSALFESLFSEYEKCHHGSFSGLEGKPNKDESSGFKTRCRVICIHYKNRSQKALVAHTFPSRRLANNGSAMRKYGKFCFEEYQQAKKQCPDLKRRRT